MENTVLPLQEGTFTLGVNYWASHAGTNMWSRWDEKVLEEDFRRLQAMNIRLLRIFPLWSDFQPIKQLYAYAGGKREIRYENEQVLCFTPEGRAGVDPVMADRFAAFCRLADKYGMKLIVALITGWMSGRMHTPRMLETLNVITDPVAIMWEVRFAQYMVKRFRGEKAIVAWELGNECNCMAPATREQAWAWAKTITMAVKELDNTRPMLSGMHSLLPTTSFSIQDQGEITDMLTTHPYPLFTPYCHTDPMTRMKSALHATAESEMYAGISGKPCFPEEVGVLGPMFVNNDNAAAYLTTSAMTAWAHGFPGYMWWCANEQTHLEHAPYDWTAIERELGAFDSQNQPKPVLRAMSELQKYADAFPVKMTAPIKDAVCILTHDQDHWAAAYGCFLLAKQAGLDLRFCYAEGVIPQSNVYLAPSLLGFNSWPVHVQKELLDRVKAGATLYISSGNVGLSPFEDITGLRPDYRMEQPHTDKVQLADGTVLTLSAPITAAMTPTTAKTVLAAETGAPALTMNAYGKGTVWFLGYSLEHYVASTPNAIYEDLQKIYEVMSLHSDNRIAKKDDACVGLTEHIIDDAKRVLVCINYEPEQRNTSVQTAPGWLLEQALPLGACKAIQEAGGILLDMAPNSGISLILKKA